MGRFLPLGLDERASRRSAWSLEGPSSLQNSRRAAEGQSSYVPVASVRLKTIRQDYVHGQTEEYDCASDLHARVRELFAMAGEKASAGGRRVALAFHDHLNDTV